MTPPAPKPSVRVIEELRGLMAAEAPPGESGETIAIHLTKSESDLLRAMHRHLPALLAVVEAAEEMRKSADVKISEYPDGRKYVRFDPHGVNLLGLMQSLSALDATGGGHE